VPELKAKGEAQTGSQTITMLGSQAEPLLDKRLPVSYATYRTIRKQPTVALARALTVAPVVAGEWSFEVKDDVTDDRLRFIQDQVAEQREPFVQKAMEDSCDYGWSPWEKVFVLGSWEGKKRLLLRKLKSLLVDITDIRVDRETGQFAGFQQPPTADRPTYLDLDLDYSLLIPFRVEGTNWYGAPLLENIRAAYDWWDDTKKGANRYDKKVAGSHWVVYFPIGSSKVDGVETDNATIAAGILENLEASGSVAVPRKVQEWVEDLNAQPEGKSWEIVLLTGSPMQSGFNDRLGYLDKLFVRGLLTPERAVLEGEYGTKAEAAVHATIGLAVRELEHRHVTRLFNWHVVDQLLAYNFGDEARGTVKAVAAPLVDDKLAFFQAVYTAVLANPAGFLDATDALDLDALVDAVGLPKAEEVVPGAGSVEGMSVEHRLAQTIQRLYEAANRDAGHAA